MKHFLLAVVATLVTSLGLLTVAAPRANARPTTVAIQVAMQLDCTHMDAKTRAYAVSHAYCPDLGDGAPVAPMSTVAGV